MESEDLVVYLELTGEEVDRLDVLAENLGTTYDDVVSRLVSLCLVEMEEL